MQLNMTEFGVHYLAMNHFRLSNVQFLQFVVLHAGQVSRLKGFRGAFKMAASAGSGPQTRMQAKL